MRVRMLATLAAMLLLASVTMADSKMIIIVIRGSREDVNALIKCLFGNMFADLPDPHAPPSPGSNSGSDKSKGSSSDDNKGSSSDDNKGSSSDDNKGSSSDQSKGSDPNASAAEKGDPPAGANADDVVAKINASGGGSSDAGDLGFGCEVPKQKGLIAWNGKEELLAMQYEETASIKGAYMSVMPLGGKPTGFWVKKGNEHMWTTAENIFKTAFKNAGVKGGAAGDLGALRTTKIGVHDILIWKIDKIETFVEDVTRHINKQYKGKGVPLIDKNVEKFMKSYIKNGYHYFAFDIVAAPAGTKVAKATILYQFETPEVFYPLMGDGKGGTEIDLLVVSDKEKLNTANPAANKVFVEHFQNHFNVGRALLTHKQAATIDPEIARMFMGHVKDEATMKPTEIKKANSEFHKNLIAFVESDPKDEKKDKHPHPQLYARWFQTKEKTDIKSFAADFRLKDKGN